MRFYELAKRQEWQVRDLPWGEIPPIPEGGGSPQRRARRRDMWRSVLSQQLQADMLACEMASQLLNAAPDPEAKLYYSTMVQDESRHTEAWLKLVVEAGGTAERDPHLDELCRITLEADTLEEKVFQMQVFFERLIIGRFRLIARASPGTVLEDLCKRLTTDDGIHHGAGMAYERVLLEGAGRKMNQRLVDAGNRLLPVFVEARALAPEGARVHRQRHAAPRRGAAPGRSRTRDPAGRVARDRRQRHRAPDVQPVTATLMRGAPLAGRVKAEVAAGVRELGELGLATVLVGDDPASHVYVSLKHKAAHEVGIRSLDTRLPEDTGEQELLELVARLNDDDTVDGILVQLPLPSQIDEARVIRAIRPVKDVDGLHPINAGELYLGNPTLVPATPMGVMALLAEHEIPLTGANAVVVGRSTIVGKPVAQLLLQANATVTICHSRTRDLGAVTREADVLVVAVGIPAVVTAEMVKEGAAVVDVGITRTEAGLVGDVDPGVAERAAFLTPVPGGVGPMTIAMLLRNTVLAARLRRGTLASS